MSVLRPAFNDIKVLLGPAVRAQMLEDIAANGGKETFWWAKLRTAEPEGGKYREPGLAEPELQIDFVEAAACGAVDRILANFPDMECGDLVLRNCPAGPVRPAAVDRQLADELAARGIGFCLVDNCLETVCVVARPVLEMQEQPLELDRLSDLLGPQGPLAHSQGPWAHKARRDDGEYEDRQAQQQLLRLVGSGFNDSKIVAAEGGTGIGKSFAYLLPAAFWAVHNKQRVVVSTATINLQQQLIEKDIPLIREISGLDGLRAELVKGRSNYVCRRRLKQAEAEEAGNLGLADRSELAPESGEVQDFAAELASIAQWVAVTKDGSLSDLNFRPQRFVWSQVCGESDNCLGLRCEFHESCFIIRARRRAAAAHILVVNHHLLFADLGLRGSGEFGYEKTAVLPPYHHVILDEAHNMERSAQSFFSQNLSQFSAQRSLRRLYFKRRERERGIWAQLRRHAELAVREAKGEAREAKGEARKEAEGQAIEQTEELPDILACAAAVEQAFCALDAAAAKVLEAAGRPENSPGNLRLPEDLGRLPAAVRRALDEQLWPQLCRLRAALTNLLRAQHRIYELLEDALEGEEERLLLEWRQISRRFEALRAVVLQWLQWRLRQGACPQAFGKELSDELEVKNGEEIERVFWLEKCRRGGRGEELFYQRLISTQVDIGGLLQGVLYEPMRTVVMVSATLTVRGRFDYWFSRVGLGELQKQTQEHREQADESQRVAENRTIWPVGEEDCAGTFLKQAGQPGQPGQTLRLESARLSAAVYASPFDYRGRVQLLLASDAPNPSFGRDFDAYVARFARQAIESMAGRSLLLFTSYASLNKCYEFLLDSGEMNLLRQGEDDSVRLLQRFKQQESASLLATDSFWEGVDAAGATLMQVLICRLPFRTPEDPIVAARTEYLERRGENAFFSYSLPEAVLRFRQGFGRLMRRASDRGLVIVLDPRIVSKRYGQDFLASLPPAKIVRGDFASLQQCIRNYAADNL